MRKVTIAAVQMQCSAVVSENIEKADAMVRQAAVVRVRQLRRAVICLVARLQQRIRVTLVVRVPVRIVVLAVLVLAAKVVMLRVRSRARAASAESATSRV